MKNTKANLYKFIAFVTACAIICVAMLCACLTKLMTYFEYDYIIESAFGIMALKAEEVSQTHTLLYASPSMIDTPIDKADYVLELEIEEPTYEESIGVIAMDLSRNPASGEVLLTNETAYNPDLISLLSASYPIPRSQQTFVKLGISQKAEPLVLILHTHGTEAYYPLIRSTNTTENIVSVGSLMADILNSRGVSTLHCDIMHDEESYLNSYNRSLETILQYLAEYTSIKYVLDVHRDAVIDANGNTVKAVTTVDGVETAQVMTVVGTDYKGGNHPNWQNNLNIAVKLQNLLNTEFPNIARPINIRSATFNAQYAPGSLLLEIGSSGNTLTEAKRAAIITANKLADLILGSE